MPMPAWPGRQEDPSRPGRSVPDGPSELPFCLSFRVKGSFFSPGMPPCRFSAPSAVFWYNVLYTGLKRVSAFAVVPGALVGAIPPAMGWAAGGGSLADPSLAALVFFFFMWQVPHFWLHLLTYGNEHAEAGLPSLTDVFSRDQMERLTFQWVSATAVSALLLGLSGLLQSPLAKACLAAASLWLVSGAISLMLRHEENHALLFRRTNSFMLVVMALTLIDNFPDALPA